MTRATRGSIRDAAGGYHFQPFPAFSMAAALGMNGDDPAVRRAVGRYLHWRTERLKALGEVARLNKFMMFSHIARRRQEAMTLARNHHQRVLWHLRKAREAQADYERRKQDEEIEQCSAG